MRCSEFWCRGCVQTTVTPAYLEGMNVPAFLFSVLKLGKSDISRPALHGFTLTILRYLGAEGAPEVVPKAEPDLVSLRRSCLDQSS